MRGWVPNFRRWPTIQHCGRRSSGANLRQNITNLALIMKGSLR